MTGLAILPGTASGPVLELTERLSLWGGVDPLSGRIIDAHHPQAGQDLAGRVVLMPTSRGSCSGSGVLLNLALSGTAPAALVFREAEDILTLGARVADIMLGRPLPVARLAPSAYASLAAVPAAAITPDAIIAPGLHIPLRPQTAELALSDDDRAMRDGRDGPAVQIAMRLLIASAAQQGAAELTDVSRVHIDGCIYASPANLRFAETMAAMRARVRVPTTTNAISVDHDGWPAQGVPSSFGEPAQALADAYVAMGASPSFTCAPYQNDPPAFGEVIGWAESNAVIYANSVLGARTLKHPDFLDLCIALTGRAPLAGVYQTEARRPAVILDVTPPPQADDAFWPLLGHLAGSLAPDAIPLIRGCAAMPVSPDDLRALCAAFGTTSAAPMLHLEGHTPEATLPPVPGARTIAVGLPIMAADFAALNDAPDRVDLVAIGSPHASAAECRALLAALEADPRPLAPRLSLIVTLGRETLEQLGGSGIAARLAARGVRVVPDLCWCSISEPVFPPSARVVMTNSGKYAHYGPGLTGRRFRFGGLAACVEAALGGVAPPPPAWLS
ncbi:aconitase X [Paracoccus suum]|uniref:cis-3-hydroxy-L-proline dehydratase n=1 Tax=Paracoccus suum TaxID=2259340 RepID=UPI001F547584|nr:aconitase X [Paracoccus suum]